MVIILPVDSHVPISADNNSNINTALSVEKPTKSYAIYGHLHNAGEVGYYQFSMHPGDRLTLSLMTTGFGAPVPDMVVMSPGNSGPMGGLPQTVDIPPGYQAELIKGQKPVTAEYEPFSPAAIFTVASYSKNITQPGTYYVAVISPADETQYSIASGYLEEFSLQEWVLVPIHLIATHLWEGQSIIAILAPFLAIIILGLILKARHERDNRIKKPLSFWLATIAGLCYLGGASYPAHFCPDTNHARYLDAAYCPFNIPAIQKGSVIAGNHRAAWTAILGRAYYRASNCIYCSSGAGTILTQIPQPINFNNYHSSFFKNREMGMINTTAR